MPHTVAFIDLEVSENSGRILDAGVIKNEVPLHSNDMRKVASFLKGSEFLCGHNILDHDIKYLSGVIDPGDFSLIDTLYLSPLLFPRKPYHALLKDDKLQSEQLNNPVNDCQKCQLLFYDELNAFRALPREERQILCCLLSETEEFKGFFSYLNYRRFPTDLSALMRASAFAGVAMRLWSPASAPAGRTPGVTM